MKKKKKIILVVLVILALILIACVVILSKYKTKKQEYETKIVDGQYTQQDIDIIAESVESYVSDKVVPTGISRLYGKYKGENELSDLYRGIKKVTDYIPLIGEKLSGNSSTEIKKYYSSNKIEVVKNTGITSEDDFVDFIEYITQFSSLQTLISSDILIDTIETDDDYLMFNLKLVYENDQELLLKTYFKKVNDKKKDELFKFTVIE